MSIIIPVLNEEILLPRLLNYLRLNDPDKHCEIIVVDANSEDNSLKIAEEKCDVVISTSIRSRAHQMNLGTRTY